MKKGKLLLSLLLGTYALSFLTIDNAFSTYIITAEEKQFNINITATSNIKRFYFVTYNWWNNGSTVGQYIYLFNSTSSAENATFPGENIKSQREIVYGTVSDSADDTSNECKYYVDVNLDLYDSCILTRALASDPTTATNQYNQTVDITLDENYDTYFIDNDNNYVSDKKYQYTTNMKNIYVRTESSTWGSSSALTYLYLYKGDTNNSWPGYSMYKYSSSETYTYYWYPVNYDRWSTFIIARINPNNTNQTWNQTGNITLSTNYNLVIINGYASSYTYNSNN